MSKSSQPLRGKNTALNHSMRQEGLHILVTHSQNQEPTRSLDKSYTDVIHAFFHVSSPIPQDCIKTDSCQVIQTLHYSIVYGCTPHLTHPSPLLSGPDVQWSSRRSSSHTSSLTPATEMTTTYACLTSGIAQKSYI